MTLFAVSNVVYLLMTDAINSFQWRTQRLHQQNLSNWDRMIHVKDILTAHVFDILYLIIYAP